MLVIFNWTVIARPNIQDREELLQVISRLEQVSFEVLQCTTSMLLYTSFCLQANQLSLLNVECGLKCMAWIPLCWVLSVLVDETSSVAIPSHPLHFAPQLPLYQLLSGLVQACRSVHAAVSQYVLRSEYIQVVLHQWQHLWVHHSLTACW